MTAISPAEVFARSLALLERADTQGRPLPVAAGMEAAG